MPVVPASLTHTLASTLLCSEHDLQSSALVIPHDRCLQGDTALRMAHSALDAAIASLYILAVPGLSPEVYLEEVGGLAGGTLSTFA